MNGDGRIKLNNEINNDDDDMVAVVNTKKIADKNCKL